MAHNLTDLHKVADQIVTQLKPAFAASWTIERAGKLLHSVDQVYESLPAIWVAPGDMTAEINNRGSHFFIEQTWLVTLVISTAEGPLINTGETLALIIDRIDNWAPENDRARLLLFSGASAPEYDRGQVLYPLTFETRLPIISKRT